MLFCFVRVIIESNLHLVHLSYIKTSSLLTCETNCCAITAYSVQCTDLRKVTLPPHTHITPSISFLFDKYHIVVVCRGI